MPTRSDKICAFASMVALVLSSCFNVAIRTRHGSNGRNSFSSHFVSSAMVKFCIAMNARELTGIIFSGFVSFSFFKNKTLSNEITNRPCLSDNNERKKQSTFAMKQFAISKQIMWWPIRNPLRRVCFTSVHFDIFVTNGFCCCHIVSSALWLLYVLTAALLRPYTNTCIRWRCVARDSFAVCVWFWVDSF